MTTVSRRTAMTAMAGIAAGLAAPAMAQEKAAPPMVPGPDPNTKTPDYKAPAGSIDSHTHIFGPQAKYPFSDKRSYTPPDAGLDLFRDVHAKIGVTRAVIVNATVHGRDNQVVLDAIAGSNGLYKGVANADETFTDKELQALTDGGMKGCRFTFLSRLGGRPDMTAFNRIVDKVKAFGWHVDLYFEPDMIEEFAPMLKALPVNYVIDHMGGIQAKGGIDQKPMQALVNLLKSDEKAWIKITGPERMSAGPSPFHDTIPFAQALIAAAPDRCLWGTDWPHPNVKVMPNDGVLVDLVPLYAPDPAQQQKLMVDNPVRLYGFSS